LALFDVADLQSTGLNTLV